MTRLHWWVCSLLLLATASGLRFSALALSDVDSATNAPAWLHLTVRDLDTGEPVGARLQLRSGQPFSGVRRELVRAGRADVRCRAGTYRVIVSRGPEWSLAQRNVRLSAGTQTSLRLGLRREVRLSSYASADLHLHTAHSRDGHASLEERLASVDAEGVQIAGLTDHNLAIAPDARSPGARPAILPGAELTTWAPEFGHFNAFPLATVPSAKRSSPARLFQALRGAGARFVQVNHPRLMRHIAYFDLMNFGGLLPERPELSFGFDGVEIWNGYDLHRPAERDRVIDDWQHLLARGFHITATGGSDAHGLADNLPGYPRTYVGVDAAQASDPIAIAEALRRGRAFVSNGPLVELEVDGHGPGETLALGARARTVPVRVRVRAAAHVDVSTLEIWLDGRNVRELALAGPASEHRFTLHVRAGQTLLAVVRGVRPMDELLERGGVAPFAITNPVWFAQKGVEDRALDGMRSLAGRR